MSVINPKRTSSDPGHCTVEWQRNGREEYIVGIITPLSFDEPFGIAAVAFHHTIVTCGEEVRIGTRKRHRFKTLTCSEPNLDIAAPQACPIGRRSQLEFRQVC